MNNKYTHHQQDFRISYFMVYIFVVIWSLICVLYTYEGCGTKLPQLYYIDDLSPRKYGPLMHILYKILR